MSLRKLINLACTLLITFLVQIQKRTIFIYGPECHDIVQSVMEGVNGTIFAYVCRFILPYVGRVSNFFRVRLRVEKLTQ
jgi:hypothetical protein